MHAKQELSPLNPDYCDVKGYDIFTYSSFLETFITLFRASMGGYDVGFFAVFFNKMLYDSYLFPIKVLRPKNEVVENFSMKNFHALITRY